MLLNGCLLSVNPIALRQNLSIFWENKRNLSYLETKRYGRIASFEVGATCVGSMNYSEDFPRQVSKGEEKGWFAFGGSSVLTFFEPGRVRLAEDLLLQSSQQRELYALMGEEMGELFKAVRRHLKLFEDSRDTIKLKNLVSSVVDDETQEKIDIVKQRLIKNFGYNEASATDVLNYVASIFARGDSKGG